MTAKPRTGILLLNMGGPSTLDEVHSFLFRLFTDRDLMRLPWQQRLAPWIARRRTPAIKEQYRQIGGGSPILKWTNFQGERMAALLDEKCPESAPHKAYVAFRYAAPLTETAMGQIMQDGVQRVVAFTQYPQYSCSTTGSSMNELYRQQQKLDPEGKVRWSVIDRWPTHAGLIQALAERVQAKLDEYPVDERHKAVILFSAHSLPMSIVTRGDSYPIEVSATAEAVMARLNHSNPYRVVWQSKVGPLPWLGPAPDTALKGLAKQGHRNVVLVPIAFTSDHIETLFELDKEYGHLAQELGIDGFKRAEALNGSSTFIRAMADVVSEHLAKGESVSTQFKMRCFLCPNEQCATTRNFFAGNKFPTSPATNKAG